MGAFYEEIPENLIKWILEQHLFWVASAPLSGNGHINVSPKGGDYFGVDDRRTFWYQELTGSGNGKQIPMSSDLEMNPGPHG
jgi:hypothetical protein